MFGSRLAYRRLSALSATRALLGEDTVCILRPVLHSALLDAVGLERVALDSMVVGFATSHDRVEITLAGGGTVTGDILVAADGVGSLIRRQLHPTEAPPRPSNGPH